MQPIRSSKIPEMTIKVPTQTPIARILQGFHKGMHAQCVAWGTHQRAILLLYRYYIYTPNPLFGGLVYVLLWSCELFHYYKCMLHFKVVQCLSLLQEEHLRVFWREMLSFTVLCTVRVATSSLPPHSIPTPVEPPLAFAGLTSPIKHTQNSPSAQVYAVMNNDMVHPLHLQTLVSRPHLILGHFFFVML